MHIVFTEGSLVCSGSVKVTIGGPISSWWIVGYGAGEKAVAGLTTDLAHYSLVDPSIGYAPKFQTFNAQVQMTKIIVDRLTEAHQIEEQV